MPPVAIFNLAGEEMKKTRQWWYRATETQEETTAAMRFVLSNDCVAAGIPPSFLDLLDKAIEGGRSFRPITKAETDKLKKTAETCLSLFQKQEEKVARGEPLLGPTYPDSRHDCYPCAHA